MTRIIVYYEYTEGTDNRHGDINKTINNYNELLIFVLLLIFIIIKKNGDAKESGWEGVL